MRADVGVPEVKALLVVCKATQRYGHACRTGLRASSRTVFDVLTRREPTLHSPWSSAKNELALAIGEC